MTKPRRTRRKPEPKPEQIVEVTSPPEPPRDRRLGNEFWKARSTHGRQPIFKTPENLLDAANQYFQWAHDHPLYEAKAFAYQGEITLGEVPKMRAMTIGGLCIFLDISQEVWQDYCKREGFLRVTKAIAEVIRDQKFSGAAADLLNANIIARDLGLADKTEHSGTVNFNDLADRVKRAKSRK